MPEEGYGILKVIKVKVKVNETTGRTSYRTVFSNKREDGSREYASMFIRFIKDAKNKIVENDTYIKIKEGFLSFNMINGTPNWTLVISDFDYSEPREETFDDYSEEDLPF